MARAKNPQVCICGCGEITGGYGQWKNGHNAKVFPYRGGKGARWPLSHMVPAAPILRLLDQLRNEHDIPWNRIAHKAGEGKLRRRPRVNGGYVTWKDSNLYKLRYQKWISRSRAERILRTVAELPRTPSTQERRIAVMSRRTQHHGRKL